MEVMTTEEREAKGRAHRKLLNMSIISNTIPFWLYERIGPLEVQIGDQYYCYGAGLFRNGPYVVDCYLDDYVWGVEVLSNDVEYILAQPDDYIIVRKVDPEAW